MDHLRPINTERERERDRDHERGVRVGLSIWVFNWIVYTGGERERDQIGGRAESRVDCLQSEFLRKVARPFFSNSQSECEDFPAANQSARMGWSSGKISAPWPGGREFDTG